MLFLSIISLILGVAFCFFSIELYGKSEKTNKAITTAFRILMGGYCAYAIFMIINMLIK